MQFAKFYSKLFLTTIISMSLIEYSSGLHGADKLEAESSGVQKSKPIDKNVAVIAASNNQFAFDLYEKLKSENSNLFFSPQSISSLLTMAYGGAKGDTANEMSQVLHLNLSADKIHVAQGDLIESLASEKSEGKKSPPYQLKIANRLWGQKGYSIKGSYVQLLRNNYGAKIEQLDFRNPKEATNKINTWVDEATNHKIKDIISPESIDKYQRLILTNAIYFKGKWAKPFEPHGTTLLPFYLKADKSVNVSTMHQENYFLFDHLKYDGDKMLKILVMNYQACDLSMTLLLPDEKDGLSDLEKKLSNDLITKLMSKLQNQKVLVWIPAFKFNAGFDLKRPLQDLGMKLAFTQPIPQKDAHDTADFSGIDDHHEIYINFVFHKAFIDVNEEGTEAAAATGLGGGGFGGVAPPPPPEFRADHPFLFMIRDTRTNCILFLGRVNELDGKEIDSKQIQKNEKKSNTNKPRENKNNPSKEGGLF